MFIKVYIFWNGIESENPYLIIKFYRKWQVLEKMKKYNFFGKKSSWTANITHSELQMLKLLEKGLKYDFLGQNWTFVALIGQSFQK